MIVIKGVEMPKDYAVVLKIFPDGKVGTVPYIQWCQVNRIEGAQAIPVPEPHGRLGDLDELKTAFPCGESIRTESVRATIDHMPTVIPASEEVET